MSKTRGGLHILFLFFSGIVLVEVIYWLLGTKGGVILPIATLYVLGDLSYLHGYAFFLSQVGLSALLGRIIGGVLSSVITRSEWLAQSTLRFLRMGIWLPFYVFWALPIWHMREGEHVDFTVWLAVTLTGVIAAFPTVTLSACYYFVRIRSIPGLEKYRPRAWATRRIVLQSFLILLVWQIWLHPYGWNWLDFPVSRRAGEGSAGFFLLLVFIYLLDWLFRSNLEDQAKMDGSLLVHELSARNRREFWGTCVVVLIPLALWQFLAVPLKQYFLLSAPVEVFRALYHLLVVGSEVVLKGGTIWGDVGVSLLEIAAGMLAAGSLAVAISKGMAASSDLKKLAVRVLPLTNVAPIVFWAFVFLLPPSFRVILWHKVVAVSLLTFFPLVQALWGLKEYPLACRVLLAVDEALPFAFVAMLLGEMYGATDGLGFYIVVARATLSIPEAVAAALTTWSVLAWFSWMLRFVVKRLYFSAADAQVIRAGVYERK